MAGKETGDRKIELERAAGLMIQDPTKKKKVIDAEVVANA